MRNINLANNTSKGKGYKMNTEASEGVFKTSRGFYIFKLKINGSKYSTSLPYNTLEEALEEYNKARI